MFHYIPWLSPLMVFIQLFTTFCKVNPRKMRICRWHIIMITVQLVCCLAIRYREVGGQTLGDYISCGQGFGQKNTILAIWVSYTYLTPVISVAPSCYIVWQNVVNSWQLWWKEKRDTKY